MSKLGSLLKAEREKKGLSLQEIGMSLKISPKVLHAIEEGDASSFPAKTFLRGFVKSYAQYLRLDVNQVLQLFQEEFGSTRPEEPKRPAETVTPGPVPTTPSRLEPSLRRTENSALPSSASNRIYTIVGAIALLLLIAFVAKMVDKYQRESRVTTSELPKPAVEGDKENLMELPMSVSGPVGIPVSSSGAESMAPVVADNSTTSTSTTQRLITSTTTTRPASTTSTFIPTTTSLRVTTTTTPVAASTTTTIKSKLTEVIIEALSKVTIKYSLGQGKTETLEMSADQVHTFRSQGVISLEISDGGGVNVILNGRDKGVPGTIGKTIKLTYP